MTFQTFQETAACFHWQDYKSEISNETGIQLSLGQEAGALIITDEAWNSLPLWRDFPKNLYSALVLGAQPAENFQKIISSSNETARKISVVNPPDHDNPIGKFCITTQSIRTNDFMIYPGVYRLGTLDGKIAEYCVILDPSAEQTVKLYPEKIDQLRKPHYMAHLPDQETLEVFYDLTVEDAQRKDIAMENLSPEKAYLPVFYKNEIRILSIQLFIPKNDIPAEVIVGYSYGLAYWYRGPRAFALCDKTGKKITDVPLCRKALSFDGVQILLQPLQQEAKKSLPLPLDFFQLDRVFSRAITFGINHIENMTIIFSGDSNQKKTALIEKNPNNVHVTSAFFILEHAEGLRVAQSINALSLSSANLSAMAKAREESRMINFYLDSKRIQIKSGEPFEILLPLEKLRTSSPAFLMRLFYTLSNLVPETQLFRSFFIPSGIEQLRFVEQAWRDILFEERAPLGSEEEQKQSQPQSAAAIIEIAKLLKLKSALTLQTNEAGHIIIALQNVSEDSDAEILIKALRNLEVDGHHDIAIIEYDQNNNYYLTVRLPPKLEPQLKMLHDCLAQLNKLIPSKGGLWQIRKVKVKVKDKAEQRHRAFFKITTPRQYKEAHSDWALRYGFSLQGENYFFLEAQTLAALHARLLALAIKPIAEESKTTSPTMTS